MGSLSRVKQKNILCSFENTSKISLRRQSILCKTHLLLFPSAPSSSRATAIAATSSTVKVVITSSVNVTA